MRGKESATMREHGLLSKITRGIARDRDLSLPERLQKGVRLLRDTAVGRVMLRDCDAVGAGARVVGRMRVENRGSISIGRGLMVTSTFLPVELITGANGTIQIGDEAWINFGTVISAQHSVRIGHRVMIGQHCIISDADLPEASDGAAHDAKGIEIGDDAWLAGRVTLRPGVKIGKGAVVTAGSIVDSDVPDGVVAGGIPARVLRTAGKADREEAQAAAATNGLAAKNAVRETIAAKPAFFGTIASDFTIDELSEELRSSEHGPSVGAVVAPFGQVTQVLLQEPDPSASDFLVVWTRPDAILPSFARALAFEEVDEASLLAEVDAFVSLVEKAALRYKAVFVPTWTVASWTRGLGMLDSRRGGVTRQLLRINARLCEKLDPSANVFVLPTERWFLASGASLSPKGWYIGKMPIPRAAMAEAALDIKSALLGLHGQARKLLVLDLDDTLWGGIVGDVGWEGLRLGGHDGLGEAFVDFQRAIKNLKRRGVVLAIVSKNEESVALEAIRSHPEMILREDDFVGWKINWTDKAKNIADLATELNLGLQSIVFIDDNPVERARVREALPEVLVPEWPEDKLLYPSAFGRLRCFDTPSLSREDADRTRLYAEERKRDQLQQQVGSMAEWLKSLGMKVKVERLGPSNLPRATQLLNKTNQLNLSTRRLTENELSAWANASDRAFWTVTVSDRFGDAGLTGLLGVERDGDILRIVDYVLSCRVMGRKVEETMLHLAVMAARERSASKVVAEYLPTAKNKPCLSVFSTSGFETSDQRTFSWDAAKPYVLPDAIDLVWEK
jgi:FkbH-like protein